jgi:hypothetical protein
VSARRGPASARCRAVRPRRAITAPPGARGKRCPAGRRLADRPRSPGAAPGRRYRVVLGAIARCKGQIVEDQPTHSFFEAPKSERTKLFLSKILSH